MSPLEVMDACAAFPAAELTHPFGPETAVFKVVGKMFALLPPDAPEPWLSLKADPEDVKALVATYDDVIPGYHLSKKHWISVRLPASTLPLDELIRDSYDLVVAGLPRASRPTP